VISSDARWDERQAYTPRQAGTNGVAFLNMPRRLSKFKRYDDADSLNSGPVPRDGTIRSAISERSEAQRAKASPNILPEAASQNFSIRAPTYSLPRSRTNHSRYSLNSLKYSLNHSYVADKVQASTINKQDAPESRMYFLIDPALLIITRDTSNRNPLITKAAFTCAADQI
jgi:hypothetical protein